MSLTEQARKGGIRLSLTAASSQYGDKLDRLLDELRMEGVQAQGVAGDVTDPSQ